MGRQREAGTRCGQIYRGVVVQCRFGHVGVHGEALGGWVGRWRGSRGPGWCLPREGSEGERERERLLQ
jgi:hypothetical protein